MEAVAKVFQPTMTHDQLVQRAGSWLRNQQRCCLVVAEPAGQDLEEQPDAIGWRLRGAGSIVVECKTAISDFHGDRQKFFRRHPLLGMGRERYFMTEPGLLDEGLRNNRLFLDGWGLLECRKRTVEIVMPAIPFDHAASAYAEQRLMIALIRRREGIMPGAQVFAEPLGDES